MKAQARFWIIVAALLMGCALTLAQDPVELPGQPLAVDSPLPTVVFPDWRLVLETEDAVEYDVDLASPVTTGYAVNNKVPLKVILPSSREGAVPVVLILHYWGARDLRAERSLAAELNLRGIGAAIMSLPYHLERTPSGSRSGDLAVEPDPQKLKAVMLQAALDTRLSLAFLQSRPELRRDRIGLMGTSLGAVVAALAYAVDPVVSDVAFLVGGIDLAGILWGSSRLVPQRDALRSRGFTESRLREELAPVEPMNYLPREAPGNSFVIAGRYDTVVPRASTQALVARLQNPEVLWLDTGHYGGVFVQRRLLREVARFFEARLQGQTYRAPERLVAPTIRIAVKLDALLGPDLGVALDLVRFDAPGTNFLSAFATPRGIQLMLGHRVWQGLAVGAAVSNRGFGVGLFWSSVL